MNEGMRAAELYTLIIHLGNKVCLTFHNLVCYKVEESCFCLFV